MPHKFFSLLILLSIVIILSNTLEDNLDNLFLRKKIERNSGEYRDNLEISLLYYKEITLFCEKEREREKEYICVRARVYTCVMKGMLNVCTRASYTPGDSHAHGRVIECQWPLLWPITNGSRLSIERPHIPKRNCGDAHAIYSEALGERSRGESFYGIYC